MIFRTQVDLPEKETEIGHSQRIMLFGSCFAENIGNLLAENKFRCDVNPFGILYNPRSIVYALKQILAGKEYQKEDLFSTRPLPCFFPNSLSFSEKNNADKLFGGLLFFPP